MSLFTSITTNDMLTTNGMPTNSTSSRYVLDMFFKMGGSRTMSQSDIETMFSKAYYENRDLALRSLFYNRDIREGQGERRSFRIMFSWLCRNSKKDAIANIENIPFYGRWDDLLVALDTQIAPEVCDFILSSLKSGDKLCAKWMPRDNKKDSRYAGVLRSAWNLSPRQYRKLLVGNTSVVETLMCKRMWNKINYSTVPSKAVNQYRKAFFKNDELRFSKWVEDVKNPDSKEKINAGAIFPHDIVGKYLGGGTWGVHPSVKNPDDVLEEQWKALPNYMPKGRKILPVVDVSGSMRGLPISVAVALGIYISERNEGIFKNGFITFSERPVLQVLSGNLLSRVSQLVKSKWDMNTDLEAVFRLILTKALENKLPESEMPEDILILSDMQFDKACSKRSAISMIRSMYKGHGYTMPNIIFWNLNSAGGVPVKFDEQGASLVSGFSPSLMKSILSGSVNPISQMMEILMSDRYNKVVV